MQYNFDEIIDRRGSDALKYDGMQPYFGSNDLTPMWVADMDFRTPDFIVEALQKRLRHPVLGYSIKPDSFYSAIQNWLWKQHQWKTEKEWIVFTPGVVPACSLSVLALTQPGDRILVQPPVYFPFYHVIEGNNRKVVYNPLKLYDNHYSMDFDDLEKKAPGAKMIIISSPHNPGGHVWTKDELMRLAEIALKNDVLILSDEIHSDLVFAPNRHLPLASLSEELSGKTISTFAPSKTFNLAGLSSSFVVIPDKDIREKYQKMLDVIHIGQGNIFGTIALETAYTKGQEWLQQLLVYLKDNVLLLDEFVRNTMPDVRVMIPEATYLVWMDFRSLEIPDKKLMDTFIKNKLAVSPGQMFGPGGEGFIRVNVACPRSTLQTALNKMQSTYKELKG